MKRTVNNLLLVLVLSLGSSTDLVAQNLSADRFLAGVAARPVGDQVEQDQFMKVYLALNTAAPAEVERVLPAILQYTRSGNEDRVRGYAVSFLLGIAIRPDGADLLSSSSQGISSLIVDSNPGIQNVAVAIADFVMAKSATNKQPYVSALEAALQRTQTPQSVLLGMVGPLLFARFYDPNAVRPALEFMRRDDLTVATRTELVHSLGSEIGLPEEVSRLLVKELDDPHPWVRAAAVVAFSDSTGAYQILTKGLDDADPRVRAVAVAEVAAHIDPATTYHALAKSRIERMADDPQENAQVRELAKEALAGRAGLSPNLNVPPETANDH